MIPSKPDWSLLQYQHHFTKVQVMTIIDLRSDTVTQPTPNMKRAMIEADLGDDVLGDDPTVIRLEEMAADRLGKEAALFCVSGTMSNLVAVLTHCTRGDEMIVGDRAHMFLNEAGNASALGGIHVRTLANDERGMLDPIAVRDSFREVNVHYPRTGLVSLENTHNQCGGAVLDPADIRSIAKIAHQNNVPVHLDGARIFNASVYLDIPVSQLAADVDTICFCISKGLCAPAGSLLAGSKEFIRAARRWRQALGGGMRQVGVLAAPGLVALQEMIPRLNEDHELANRLVQGLMEIPEVSVDPLRVQTNIVMVEVPDIPLSSLVAHLHEEGLKVSTSNKRLRMVTHHGITVDDIDKALMIVKRAVKEKRSVEVSGNW
jgi:threonine aldolase